MANGLTEYLKIRMEHPQLETEVCRGNPHSHIDMYCSGIEPGHPLRIVDVQPLELWLDISSTSTPQP